MTSFAPSSSNSSTSSSVSPPSSVVYNPSTFPSSSSSSSVSSPPISSSFTSAAFSSNLSSLSDFDLFHRCRRYGHRSLYWRQKFIGLLPEVYRRRLYEKKGFGSIFEFAKRLAGLSEEQVRMTLNLEKRLEQTPRLHQLLVNGEVSINKLARVASIATKDNEQVQLLPNRALETFVRDEKQNISQVGSQKAQNEPKSLHVQTGNVQFSATNQSCRAELNLDSDIAQELLELQQKGIDINAHFIDQKFQEQRQKYVSSGLKISTA